MQSFNLVPQKAVLILSIIICVPVSVLWLYSSPVMVALGQSQQLADRASKYLMVLIPSLWTLSFSICIQNWLHAQSKTRAIAVITLIVALIHPFWCYFYIYMMEMGYLGAALAVTTSKVSEFVMLIIYIYFGSVLKETNFEFSWGAFSDWGPFLYLGLPNLLMMGEWWASEVIIFMAGSLAYPEDQVSAMSIYQNTLSICFMIPSSFHVAASTRVGNNMGAGLPDLAKIAAYTSPSLAFAGTLLVSFTLYTCRKYWAFVFTTDEVVADIVISIMPVLALYVIMDGVQTALTGVLKGLGKQRIAGPVVLFSYYCIGLPLSYYFAFPLKMGVIGLCIGTTLGTLVHMLLYFYIVISTNWVLETKKLQKKSKRESFIRQYPTARYVSENDSDSEKEEEEKWMSNKICVKFPICKVFQIFSSQKSAEKFEKNGKYVNLENNVNSPKGDKNEEKGQDSLYFKMSKALGLKSPRSSTQEYELVQSYTDSLESDMDTDTSFDDDDGTR